MIPIRKILIAIAVVVIFPTILISCTTTKSAMPTRSVTFDVRLTKDAPSPGYHEATDPSGKSIFVSDTVEIDQNDIKSAKVVAGSYGQPSVSFKLNREGAEKMMRLSSSHIKERVAFFVDGKMIMAPVIQAQISDRGLISGNFTLEEAKRIAAGLSGRNR